MRDNSEYIINYGKTEEGVRINALREIEKVCKSCYKCGLSKTRKEVVFGDGALDAKILLIGEGPGREEDETGKPFVGRAGKLLDKMLAKEGISRRENLYITNVVKCRPPGNRKPEKEEAEACRVYLESQLQLIRPKIIILAGATAVKNVLETNEPISKIRGKWFDGPFGSQVMPIFHPSYLLRYQSTEPETPRWHMEQDIKEIKKSYSKKN